jgi:type II secretory pathway component PulJ
MSKSPGRALSAVTRQRGGTVLELIVFLAIAAYGVYVAVQYYPQMRESSALETVLESVAEQYRRNHFTGEDQIWDAIDRQLDMRDMRNPHAEFKVIAGERGSFEVSVHYTRDLNRLFTKKSIEHTKSVSLRMPTH